MTLTTAQIQNAYVAFFNRPADVEGLNYWLAYTGNSAELLNTFAQSAEYKSLYSGMNNTQLVNAVYQNHQERLARAEKEASFFSSSAQQTPQSNEIPPELQELAETDPNLAKALDAHARLS